MQMSQINVGFATYLFDVCFCLYDFESNRIENSNLRSIEIHHRWDFIRTNGEKKIKCYAME